MSQFPDTPARSRYDVVIVGAGAMGSAAAWFTVSDPDFDGRVLVLEAEPGFERSATALTNSCIRQQFSTTLNIRISQEGARYIRNFRAEMGGDPEIPEIRLDEIGYLYLAGTPVVAETLAESAALQNREGVATRILDREALAAFAPWMRTSDLRLGTHNPRDEGPFDGHIMVDWWRRMARRRGAEFVHARATGIVRLGARVEAVQLSSGTLVAAGTLVNAAGRHAAGVARMAGLSVPVEPRKRYSYVFEADLGHPGPLPLTIDPSGVHVRSEGTRFLAGAAPEDDGPCDPDDFAFDDGLFERRVWPALAHRIPAFERLRLLRGWVGHYEYNRLDQNAIVGPDPECRNYLHMNGFSGHGLQQSPAMGRAIAELVVHGGYRSLDLKQLGCARILTGIPFREQAVI